MTKRLFSLRTAILLPYILAIIVILTISMTLWTRDYNWLVDEQANKVLTALSENTKQELFTFLSEPLRVNKLFAATISDQEMYDRDDMSDIQSLSTNFIKKTKAELSQLSVISFGDEKKNYVGIRANSTPGSYTLMLQDSRTKGFKHLQK